MDTKKTVECDRGKILWVREELLTHRNIDKRTHDAFFIVAYKPAYGMASVTGFIFLQENGNCVIKIVIQGRRDTG